MYTHIQQHVDLQYNYKRYECQSMCMHTITVIFYYTDTCTVHKLYNYTFLYKNTKCVQLLLLRGIIKN